MAARLDLGSLLRLGRGEERSGGRSKSALLSNALEAVIAAIYLDGGLDQPRDGDHSDGLAAAAAFIERTIIEPALPTLGLALAAPDSAIPVSSGSFSGAVGDHKSALQEHLQATGSGQPEYVLKAESGPDHRKRFHVEVRTRNANGLSTVLAESEGSTKKAAQQEAARIAFARLLQRPEPELAQEASVVRP